MRPKRPRNLFRSSVRARSLGKAARPPRLPSWPAETRTWSDLAPSRKCKCGMTPIPPPSGNGLHLPPRRAIRQRAAGELTRGDPPDP